MVQPPEAEGALSWEGAAPSWGRPGKQGPGPAGHRSSSAAGAIEGTGRGCSLTPSPGPQQRRGHHEAPHAELTFVERRVQEGVVEEQAPALSPALGLAPHHQFAVAGCLQTLRHKERGQGGSGRAEFLVVGQQGAN